MPYMQAPFILPFTSPALVPSRALSHTSRNHTHTPAHPAGNVDEAGFLFTGQAGLQVGRCVGAGVRICQGVCVCVGGGRGVSTSPN